MSTNRYDITLNKNKNIRTSAKLLYISSAKYGGDWHSTPHTHNCCELFFVIDGVGQFFIENQLHPVGANDFVIVNPHVLHTEMSLNANPMEYIVLGIEDFELSETNAWNQQYYIVNCRPIRDKVLFYLQSMLKEIENKEFNHDIICQDLMEILVILILRQTGLSMSIVSGPKKSSHLCSAIRRYIEAHYRESINLDTLVEISHVSRYYLVHAFTKEYGISPINYMISCRIEEAKQLLKNDDYPLSFISRFLGFSSPSYFSQAFKKICGLSPNEYRKQSRIEK
ncbi:helix-turn-helix domain-containing protein [Frisingicoccus sp.]|uniref:AraC family transcriptional regulator n=1 Tax=Frisingicoccus sp. TaxID=1918627 RepID=UPI003AB365A0